MNFLSKAVPLWLVSFLIWNLGFWTRVAARPGKPDEREFLRILAGIPISRTTKDLSGAMFQIAAYILASAAVLVSVVIRDKTFRFGTFLLLIWPSIFGALQLVKRMVKE